MPYFVSLMRLTQRGLDSIQNSPHRAAVSKQRVEAQGGRSVCFFATMGPYDFVQIFEMPSEAAMLEYVTIARHDGFVDPLILRAFEEEEWASITESVSKSIKLGEAGGS